VLQLLREAVHAYDQTVVMVTHDPVAASFADAVVFLADGRIAGQLARPTAEAVAERMTDLGDAVEVGHEPSRHPETAALNGARSAGATGAVLRLDRAIRG
jgi:putative ABC transport system ATP-binding protein